MPKKGDRHPDGMSVRMKPAARETPRPADGRRKREQTAPPIHCYSSFRYRISNPRFTLIPDQMKRTSASSRSVAPCSILLP